MPRALWSGAISFGLINIPVKVVSAVTDRDLHFHMLHATDGARIRFVRTCPKDGKEVPNEEIVKGYELARGQYVTFPAGELEAAAPEQARTIDISDFVALADIDPVYFEKPYYLVPDKNADKPYALLLAALDATGKVALARVVMREKESLVALRAKEGALVMETLRFSDEVVPAASVAALVKGTGTPDKRQLELAEKLVDSLTVPFDPAAFANNHRDRVLALVEQKAAGKQVVREPAAQAGRKTMDILDALEKSLAATRSRRPGSGAKPKRPVRQAGARLPRSVKKAT